MDSKTGEKISRLFEPGKDSQDNLRENKSKSSNENSQTQESKLSIQNNYTNIYSSFQNPASFYGAAGTATTAMPTDMTAMFSQPGGNLLTKLGLSGLAYGLKVS